MGKLCVLVAGATGLIGRHCVQGLLEDDDVALVQVIVRRPTGISHPKLAEFITDFEQLEEFSQQNPGLFNVDAVLCCLGTTMRIAGSKPAFERVDYHYVRRLAELAAAHKVPRFLMVSAIGASSRSPSYYSRIKGKAEEAVRELKFRSLHIMQPSLLLGDRPGATARPAEDIAQRIAPLLVPLFRGPLSRYKPVRAEVVASQMIRLAKDERPGTFVHHLG
jgi:uncharacterized protein YbjT (DUF2867 family)